MAKIEVTPWKGSKYQLVEHRSALMVLGESVLTLSMEYQFEYVRENDLGIKLPQRDSTNFLTKLPRGSILLEYGHDSHHEDVLCEEPLPVIIIRSLFNFSFWLYVKEEEAQKVYRSLDAWKQ